MSSASYHMDKKFIDYILSESGILAPDRKDEVSLLALKSVATGGKLRELKNCFRVYGAQMERPPQPLTEIEKNHLVKSSSHRIRDILNLSGGEERFREEQRIDAGRQAEEQRKIEYSEFLNKELNGEVEVGGNGEQPMSPVIGLEREPKIEPLDLPESGDFSKEKSADAGNQTSVTLKLSRKASENIKSTLVKVS